MSSRHSDRREDELHQLYKEAYQSGGRGRLYGEWRRRTAVPKAANVIRLTRQLGLEPRTIADVGCGDGAVLVELAAAGLGVRRTGYELSETAAALAAGRAGIDEVRVFDGRRIPAGDGEYDLALASHVLEHVTAPQVLLAELARIGRHVVIEVPLEANLSARRPAARSASAAAGHLHRFGLEDVRRLAAGAGLRIAAELFDPLPLEVHLWGRSRAVGYAKWATRAMIARLPLIAPRLITLHYAFIATGEG